MGIAFIIFTAVIDTWIFFTVFRSLSRGEVDPIWKKRVWVFLILGIGIAVFFAFIHRRDQPALRTAGFPIPYSIAKLQNELWTEFPMPSGVRLAAQVVDFISGFAVALLPIKVIRFWNEVKDARQRGS